MPASQPLLVPLAGTPPDRPTRRRRLCFLAGITAAVLAALSAVILLSSAHARGSLSGGGYDVRFLVVRAQWALAISCCCCCCWSLWQRQQLAIWYC